MTKREGIMRRIGQRALIGNAVALALLAGACGGSSSKSADSAGNAAAVKSAPGTVGTTDFAAASRSSAESGGAAGSAAAPAAPSAAQNGGKPADGQQLSQQLPSTDRRIVYNVFLDLTVKDVQPAFERVSLIAESFGGVLSESNVRQEGESRRASLTIRVPSNRYQEALTQIRGLAVKVESERATGNDVTEEFSDLGARRRNLEATEQQLLVFLGQAKTIQEVLQVQDRLTTTRAEIERIRGRMNLLDRLTEMATIQIQLRPESAASKATTTETGPLAAVKRGWQASLDVTEGLLTAGLTVLAFSWWLVPFALLALWLGRRLTRSRRLDRPTPVAVAAPAPADGV